MIPGSNRDHPDFKRSLLFAVQGLRFAVRTERNINIMFGVGICALVAAVIVRFSLVEWAILLVCCGIVISAELFNTAIETVVDLVSPEFHPLAGRAKDIAAAAVWVLAFLVAIVGVALYANALLRLLY